MSRINEAAQSFKALTAGIQERASKNNEALTEQKGKKNFGDFLKEKLEEVNTNQAVSDQFATNLSIGKEENIHEAMLAVAKAELSFNLMVQIRNKALEAYQEVMRMPV